MASDLKRFLKDESGPQLIEWALVTVILILAIYALLQALGPEILAFIADITSKLP